MEAAKHVDDARNYSLGYSETHGSQGTSTQACTMLPAQTTCQQQTTTKMTKVVQHSATTGNASKPKVGFNGGGTGNKIPPKKDNTQPNKVGQSENNTVTCYNCKQPGHICPKCPYPLKDQPRAAGTRMDESHHEDENDDEVVEEEVHPEEAQIDWEDPGEVEPEYEFDEVYETPSIIEEVAVRAIGTSNGYVDRW